MLTPCPFCPRPHLQGFVVGFKGSKIFCLHYVSMQVREPQERACSVGNLRAAQASALYACRCVSAYSITGTSTSNPP